MFHFFNPIEVMALSIRMALAMAEAQRTMAVQMMAAASALSGVSRPAVPAEDTVPPVQIDTERARRAGGARRKSAAGASA